MDNSIHLLPDQIINQVAAGEVIERPASVIKELIENSLDAKATKIDVSFRHAGKDFLSVCDNGSGMKSADAMLALERHATSKLRSFDDLNHIRSFGFRGEALPSIGSISRMVLRTRSQSDPIGTEILIDSGRVIYDKPCAAQIGTEIIVSQLFKTVPVRRKFLKSGQTETNHLIETVRLFAAAFPSVAFTLRENPGNEILRLTATNCLQERLMALFGRDLCKTLILIDERTGDLSLEGLILSPFCHLSTQRKSLFFVNGRPIQNPSLRDWLLEAYEKIYPDAKSIGCILFLKIAPEEIDVNVHPTKREIRFRDPSKIRQLFIEKIQACLANYGQNERQRFFIGDRSKKILTERTVSGATHSTEVNDGSLAEKDADRPALETVEFCAPDFSENQQPTDKVIPEPKYDANPSICTETAAGEWAKDTTIVAKIPWSTSTKRPMAGTDSERSDNTEAKDAIDLSVPIENANGLINWKFIGKMNDRCALFSTPTGLLFFNVFFASERIEFERILREMENPPQQNLLFPILLDLGNNYSDLDDQRILELAAIGFDVELFGPKLYRINALPIWLNEKSGEAFLYDWLILRRKKSAELQREYLAKIAANYIATGKTFSREKELLLIVHNLLACDVPNRSPSGNAIYFEIPNSDIERRWR